jgi:membrane protein YqaA with SNARE-associated domain
MIDAAEAHNIEPQPSSRVTTRSLVSLATTAFLILSSIVIVWLFHEEINAFGLDLMTRYGNRWADTILFLVTAVSSTPLALPIWGYALAAVALGYNVLHFASIMAVGAALGSFVTYSLGRYFSSSSFAARRLANLRTHPWTENRSKKYVTLFLFLGAASPIPCDIFYAACGFKRFPPVIFLITMVAARFVRYVYLGYGFLYFGDLI